MSEKRCDFDKLPLYTWIDNPSKFFVALFENLRAISEKVSYKESFRIVLDYDAEAENTIIKVFKEGDGSGRLECPEPPPLVYPHTKEP